MELGSLSLPEAWLPTPFQEFVIKVHNRCNLACSYCYMYQLADRALPPGEAIMGERVFARTIDRIAAHAHQHLHSPIRVVLHGGEPLLAGVARLTSMAAALREALHPVEAQISLQTNGVLLDGPSIDALAAQGVHIGLSLDGDRSANDRHRLYSHGRSSFDAVDRSARLLADRPHAFAGILCVVDVRNDPLTTYEALLTYRPPRVDFLLPHANWDRRPWRSQPLQYGDWLIAIFDAWYSAPKRLTRIRLFEELIHLILGGASRTESVGLSPVATIVINTDGSYEQIDTLRSAYQGAVRTGLNVFVNSLDEALWHPSIIARQRGVEGIAPQCQACSLHRVCGGGYYPHRYRTGSGFANPSVYCDDMIHLITYITNRLRADIAELRRNTW
jgi:uncharacterized protein